MVQVFMLAGDQADGKQVKGGWTGRTGVLYQEVNIYNRTFYHNYDPKPPDFLSVDKTFTYT